MKFFSSSVFFLFMQEKDCHSRFFLYFQELSWKRNIRVVQLSRRPTNGPRGPKKKTKFDP